MICKCYGIDDEVEKFCIELNPEEMMVVNKGLYIISYNDDYHIVDRKLAKGMCKEIYDSLDNVLPINEGV